MNKNPRVYVIVPIYNVEPYLRECLDSVVNQTYKNLSIILVNDGSTDNSEAIAKEYLSDERVILISKENGGQSSARNLGLQYAFSLGGGDDYIFFLDGDDFLALETMEMMINTSSRYDYPDIVRCGVARYDEKGDFLQNYMSRQIGINKEYNGVSGLDYLAKIPLMYFSPSTSSLINIDLLKENNIVFDEGLINEDLPFAFKIYIKAKKVCFDESPFYGYRARYGSTSCAETFSNHGAELLFKSYKNNCDFLLSLFTNNNYEKIQKLISYNLGECAQAPIVCWIKDKTLCKKEELRPLLPFMKMKTKIIYFFPFLARIAMKLKRWIKK